MKAFQYENSQEGLELRDIPKPEAGNGQVQLQVKAAGMCHSDCHIVSGSSDAWLTKKPITLGHEVAGIITEIGPGVAGFSLGDRVAVSQVCHPVEERDWSLGIGLGFDGGYAQYAVAPARRLIHIPEGVTFAQAAVATDALATSYHAVVAEAGAKPGMTIGVVGLGGLGMSGLAFGALQGAVMYGFDIDKDKFEEATRLGASGCFESLDLASDVVLDAIVDFAGTGHTTQSALRTVKEGGKVVLVGLAAKTAVVSTELMVLRTVTLVGSLGASVDDLAQVLKLLKEGLIDPMLVEVPFSEIPASIDALAKGGVKGRCWADPSKVVE
ncbi:PKS-ER domain-containing protein [Fusarium falciforme]|uniref:PKS-ER domain-containing protein n=1 Tax=Fusarium falciforme TaxID=195108 RepID=UPI002300533B|nr:PKS-ER domain-containing protein [Fusarium falciforme]WAO90759.1 PKS-ER domain-containing protein [Fusarium falciforme]